MRQQTSLFLLLLVVAMLLGCDRPAEPATAPPAPQAAAPARIVSLAPSVTETLFALSVGERVVGVSRYCDFPPEVEALPKVGGLTDIDVEAVLAMRPDLVVGVRSETGAGLERALQATDVKTLFVPVETFAQMQDAIRAIGDAVGAPARATEIADAVAATNATTDTGDAPSVLVLFGRDPWVAAGPGTFADEMIARAGGRNVLAHLDNPYPTLDVEQLMTLDVALVIDTSWGENVAEVPARGATVVRLDPDLMRPGPRIVDAVATFRRAIDEARGK